MAQALLFAMAKIAGYNEHDFSKLLFAMPGGSSITLTDAADMYPELSIANKEDLKGLKTDISNTLDSDGYGLLSKQHPVAIMGHTHVCKLLTHYVNTGNDLLAYGINSLYANTGFLCAAMPDLISPDSNKQYLTFAEVEHDVNSVTVRIQKVDYPTINISKLMEYTIPAKNTP